MVLAGAQSLNQHVKDVNALNVFPVPDGDTGTNMDLSLTSGVNELKKRTTDHIGQAADALAKGLLMGARGNSGVILSQLFRGFSKYVSSYESIDSKQFAEALKQGVDTAYKAVMKPVEGTILTVSREVANEAVKVSRREKDLIKVMEAILNKGKQALAKTPDLLPILKQVGVVDAGGQGLLYIYEGFLAALKGEKIVIQETKPTIEIQRSLSDLAHEHMPVQAQLSTEDIKFGYCTEFMIRLKDEILQKGSFNEQEFRKEISQFGDSLLVVSDDEMVKVHIHTEYPGDVLNYAMKYGSLHKIKIDNMREQHSHILLGEGNYHTDLSQVTNMNDTNGDVNPSPNEQKEKQPYSIIAVAMGEGIAAIFKSLGVDVVISGGQTMNPSTQDIVNAIKEINAENYIVLPNNSNIILAAEQAQEFIDQPVAVIPSKTLPQGMASLLAFNPDLTIEENKEIMTEALKSVKSGQVTYAVRDSKYDGLEIKKGNYLGIFEGKIVATSDDMIDAAFTLLTKMIDEEEVLTIIFGEDVKEDQVKVLKEKILEQYPELEIEVHNGGQPLYYFIFSIE
ncbi:DAK2 domain-containing protein [Tepidibacillus sp. LV47]|uniref:DAK2 domain-containing protein n=1 Tax=Tepidibacillus sp. LV47 TaxID=3398228 RepID=UPI003AAD4E75